MERYKFFLLYGKQIAEQWYLVYDLASYLIGLTIPEHSEFAIGDDLHTVTLYGSWIEVLVWHHVLWVSGVRSVPGYLADLVDDLLAGGVHVPANQAIISRRNAYRAAWFFHRARFRHCRGYHRSRSYFPEKYKRLYSSLWPDYYLFFQFSVFTSPESLRARRLRDSHDFD